MSGNERYTFECPYCGCTITMAEDTRSVAKWLDEEPIMECPNCGEMIFMFERVEILGDGECEECDVD